MDILAELVVFALKVLLIVVGVIAIIAAIARSARRGEPGEGAGMLRVKKLNERWARTAVAMKRALLGKKQLKAVLAEEKRKKAAEAASGDKTRAFVLDFAGNLRASQVTGLAEEVGAVLEVARPGEEVVVRVKSPGGLVHGYGLAAAQLERLRDHGLTLTVAVDQVAASGGYMMAVVAHRIVSAPFAVVGSIGVVAGFPNFNRWLKRRDIDYELVTAGRYKRTMTMLGENTEEGRKKFQEELESAHSLFKAHIAKYRPTLDLDKVATGEHWYGQQALGLGLVDQLGTSDDYLKELGAKADVFHVQWVPKRRFLDRVGSGVEGALTRGVERLWEKAEESRFP